MIDAIAIVNRSTCVTDADLVRVVTALQIQLDRDVCPVFAFGKVTLAFVGLNDTAPPNTPCINVADHTTEAGDLGFHELTPDGQPQAFIFAADDMADGVSWSVTLSHEMIEMLGDPDVNKTMPGPGGSYQVAYELCDATEDDQFGYYIDLGDGKPPVKVSDAVTPAYFTPGAAGPYDLQNHVSRQFQILDGGYESRLENGQWLEVNARKGNTPSRHDRAMQRGTSRLQRRIANS